MAFLGSPRPSAFGKCMYEKIDDSTIALEWLDTTLAEMKYRPEMRIYSVITAVKAAFTSCIILGDQQHVNTGRILGLDELSFTDYSRL